MIKRVSKVIETEVAFKESKEPLILVTLTEFINNITKDRRYPIESGRSFAFWIRKQGCPKRWPYSMWLKEFKNFLNREVK